MTHPLRLLAGVTALVAGLCVLSGAAAPALPPAAYKRAAEADIAALQKCLQTCADTPDEARRFVPTAKSVAMVLAAYAEATGDAELKDQSLKVAVAVGELQSAVKTKNPEKITAAARAAGELAKKLAAKPGSAPLKATDPQVYAGGKYKYALDEIMSPYRPSRTGGLNIEKDIRDMIKTKDPAPVDPAAVEVLAARVAVLSDYTIHFPNDKAESGANKALWEKYSKETIDISQKLAAEAGKGKGANEKEMVKLLKALDAKCTDCHGKFRDD